MAGEATLSAEGRQRTLVARTERGAHQSSPMPNALQQSVSKYLSRHPGEGGRGGVPDERQSGRRTGKKRMNGESDIDS